MSHKQAPSESREAYCTSGTSPTDASVCTVHLVGPGQVGREFLRLLSAPLRLIGITDSSATLHDREGLDPVALAELKAGGGRLLEVEGAESLPVDLATDLVGADVVVDATTTDVGNPERAVRRSLKVLRRGACLALAAKDAVSVAGDRLLSDQHRDRVGINAVLGGTGYSLSSELSQLRRSCLEVALVGNASTTAVVEKIERGGTIEEGIRQAQEDGLLETDPELDLSGLDAAAKLVTVVGALWGRQTPVDDVDCEHLRSLDEDELQRRFRSGTTTRLVGRAETDGNLRVAYEEISQASPLAVPRSRVAYTYRLGDGQTRVHVGHGIGPRHTAEALLLDVRAFSSRTVDGRTRERAS